MAKTKDSQVYSVRINKEILDVFKDECERLNVNPKYIISEYMKKFIVLNSKVESFEKAVQFDSESNDFMED